MPYRTRKNHPYSEGVGEFCPDSDDLQPDLFVLCNKNSKTLANFLPACYNQPVTKAEARVGWRGRGGLRKTGTGCRARGGRTAEGKEPVFSWGARKNGAHCHEPWSAACVVLSSGNDGSGACGRPANETRDVCLVSANKPPAMLVEHPKALASSEKDSPFERREGLATAHQTKEEKVGKPPN